MVPQYIYIFFTQVLIDSQWTAHTARVTSINWAPSSQYFVSGSLDTNLVCFEPPKPRGYAMHKGERSNVIHKGEGSNVIHKGEGSNVIHKSEGSNVIHKGERPKVYSKMKGQTLCILVKG